MLNAVLYHELLLGSRRNKSYWLRWAIAGWLLLQWSYLLFMALTNTGFRFQRWLNYMDFGAFCRTYGELFVAQHFLLLLLATPTLTAGAITDEKNPRGTLQYLLTAGMEPWEIVVGKLLGRLYQVMLLAMTGLPLLCFFGVFGGLDPPRLVVVVIATLLVTFALAGMSIYASVRSRHTRDAVLGLYAVLALVFAFAALVLPPLTGVGGFIGKVAGGLAWFLDLFNPLEFFRSGWTLTPTQAMGQQLFLSGLAWFAVGACFLGLAVLRLRGSYQKYLESSGRKRKHWWTIKRKPVTDSPLVWKERHVEGIAPLAMLRGIPTSVGLALIFFLTLGLDLWLVVGDPSALWRLGVGLVHFDLDEVVRAYDALAIDPWLFYIQGVIVMLVTGLVISIRCSGTITGEREKQTWEALLLTPLETKQLVRAKLWGVLGASLPYLAAYGVPALALSALAGLNALLWTFLWIGVTLLAVAFVGAAGLWCSVRAKSSWRSLLGTLAITYVGGTVLFCIASPFIYMLAIAIMLMLMLFDALTGAGTLPAFAMMATAFQASIALFMAGVFAFVAWALVASAEYRVGILERTKHWKNEPYRLPTLQPRPAATTWTPPVATARVEQPPLYQVKEIE